MKDNVKYTAKCELYEETDKEFKFNVFLILYWDNHTTNKIYITGDTMYITKNIMNL